MNFVALRRDMREMPPKLQGLMRASSWSSFNARIVRCRHTPVCKDCCWLWFGCIDQAGYGRVKFILDGAVEWYAHRVAWFIHAGASAGDWHVCHRCDIPRCCNPEHLWLGTPLTNQQDSTLKGRRSRAGKPRKLTPAKVRRIRKWWVQGQSQRQLAQHFGVSQPLVQAIVARKAWKQVE